MRRYRRASSNMSEHADSCVLIVTGGFPPAFRWGGPARSISAITERLGSEFAFVVVASAFDLGQPEPLPGIDPDVWARRCNADVFYSSSRAPVVRIFRLGRRRQTDLLYLNSFFSVRYSLLPLLAFRLGCRRVRVLVAPRGELSDGAMTHHAFRKRSFIALFRLFRLQHAVMWHASTGVEAGEIRRAFVEDRGSRPLEVGVAIDLFSEQNDNEGVSLQRFAESPRIVFFSRIDPKKNLHGLLASLRHVSEPVDLTIAGPVSNDGYWRACAKEIDALRGSHTIRIAGAIEPSEVHRFLEGFALFVLPTLGENYGHVIREALAAGTPAIVGRDTPWGDIESSKAGWLCDPDSPQSIADRINLFLTTSTEERILMSQAATQLVSTLQQDGEGVGANRRLFRQAIERK
jgi:glycosyltransferase involved in cell wall biosynthesis